MRLPTISFLFLMCAQSVHAEDRIINYVAKITNNSDKPFTLNCIDFKWRPVLFSFPSQLTNVYPTYNDTIPQQDALIERTKLDNLRDQEMQQEDYLLRMKGESEEQIMQDPMIRNYERLIAQQIEKLRPVIKPKQVIDCLACRLVRNIDQPTEINLSQPQPVNVPFVLPKPSNWKPAPTCVSNDKTIIKIIDTNSTQGCPDQQIRVEGRSNSYTAYCCVENSGDMGRIHLIINPDSTFSLERIFYTDYKP